MYTLVYLYKCIDVRVHPCSIHTYAHLLRIYACVYIIMRGFACMSVIVGERVGEMVGHWADV